MKHLHVFSDILQHMSTDSEITVKFFNQDFQLIGTNVPSMHSLIQPQNSQVYLQVYVEHGSTVRFVLG